MRIILVAHYKPMIRICKLLEYRLKQHFEVSTLYSYDADGHESTAVHALRDMEADYVITPSGQMADRIPDKCGKVILVNHGPVPHKNHRPVQNVFAVVGAPYALDAYKKLGQMADHWWDLGYVEMDAEGLDPGFEEEMTDGFMVYAPTYHEEHAGPVKRQKRIMAILSDYGKKRAVFAPHPIIPHSDVLYRFAEHLGMDIFQGDGSIVSLLSHHFIRGVVTDYSAVIPLAIGCGIPVFAYNSFRWWTDPEMSFSMDDVVLEMREACYQFTAPEELEFMLKTFDDIRNDPLSSLRNEWRSRIFGGRQVCHEDTVADLLVWKLKGL